jgi:hypothetical protein
MQIEEMGKDWQDKLPGGRDWAVSGVDHDVIDPARETWQKPHEWVPDFRAEEPESSEAGVE